MFKKLCKLRIRAPIHGENPGERGQGLAEYAMILILVGIIVIIILAVLGEDIRNTYCQTLWTTVGPDTPAAMCENIAMTCQIDSVSPTRARAVINDGSVTIDHVYFYVDGSYRNDEYFVTYCLIGGSGPCQPVNLSSGTHRITAIAVSDKGTTGRCTTTVDVP